MTYNRPSTIQLRVETFAIAWRKEHDRIPTPAELRPYLTAEEQEVAEKMAESGSKHVRKGG